MYKLDSESKRLVKLIPKKFGELGLKERFDIEEWIEKSPEILGEDFLIISKELPLPSGIRLDLLAVDKKANLVVIELKRDDSGSDVEWQAIKYVSYCSNFLSDDIFTYFAQYLESDTDSAKHKIEDFIEEETQLEKLNQNQRIILLAKEFHSDVVSAVLWLRDYEVEINCIRLQSYVDNDGDVFITSDLIIPLPEAKDYVEKKEVKEKEAKRPIRRIFSLEKGTFKEQELKDKLKETLARQTDLIPRFVRFIEILLSEDRAFGREEVKQKLVEKGVDSDIGHAGRYLSNLSQFLTKPDNTHLRQVIEFETGGGYGETKDNYHVIPEYRSLLQSLVEEYNKAKAESEEVH
jgi:hypothetical protein